MAQRYSYSTQPNATNVSVGTSSTSVLSANPSRKGLILSNTGANPIYVNLGGGAATANNMLLPSGSAPFTLMGGCPTGAIFAIAATSATNLSVTELT